MIRSTFVFLTLFSSALSACANGIDHRLSSFIANGTTLTHEGKLYSNFSGEILFNSGDSTPTTLDDIEVFTTTGGIKFQGDFSVNGNGFLNIMLGYTVETIQANMEIAGVGLSFDAATSGDGEAAVVEGLLDMNDTLVGKMSVSADQFFVDLEDPPLDPMEQDDTPLTGPQTKLNVTKTVLLSALSGTSSFSMINQTFEMRVIPEPATLVLAGFACLAPLGRRG